MEQTLTLGKRIAALRKEKGLTQEQLAEKVGVSAQAVSKWENDQSCPDITLLPLLASLFGVTVDALLGVKPVEPNVIILDKKEETIRAEDRGRGDFHWEWNVGNWSTIAFCIGMIMICLVFVLRSMTPLFPDLTDGTVTLKAWSYVWPLLIFTFGLITVRSSAAAGAALMAFGGYEFVRRALLPYGVRLIGIPWYVVLLVFAIVLLAMTIYRRLRPRKTKHGIGGENRTPVRNVSQENDRLAAELSFGAGRVTYESETLLGGRIETNFGDYEIDLSGVKTFADDCLLNVEQNFGNLTILLPQTVRMVKSSDVSFASFSVQGKPYEDAVQSLILRGEVNFGSLQVKYTAG